MSASMQVFQQQPHAQPSPSTYVDLPITLHRVIFSYLGSPTGLITTVLALLILVASYLPFASTTCFAIFGCPVTTYTTISLAYLFPLLWILPVGAVIVMLAPALSLWGRRYGRTIRGLTYCLIGVLGILAPVTYAAFHSVYTPQGGLWPSFELYYPFYLMVAVSSILIPLGILEWIRWPRFLFRPYSPPPPKPPKPKRRVVPEVVSTAPSGHPAVVEEGSFAPTPTGAVEPPIGQALERPNMMRPPTAQTSSLDRLIKLKELLDSGAITKEEFEQQKQMILAA